ncbi:Ca(2+)-dependent cysteine protease [Kickxella alabastrina]|uniref:Ca(2+)-dependent cysteine protease n=1 Tax=Kickxella alabastrina TaxID=61397 RepID=A0ACC1IIC6_9FUNG|nr:Ca(2+)-dependent cysteine protease [Kickxella alabastrina]
MASDAPLAPLLHHHSTSQYASHPPPPLHIQQAQQMQQMQMRKSPSPVPLSQAQMRREHSYRTASGQQGPGQIASTWPSMGTRQDTRNNYPEHHASYITGQTPISSVLTAEPIVAGINMPNLTMQRSHGPGPDGGYAGSPPQVPSMLSSRRREQSFYDYSRDSGAVPPPVGRPGSMSTLVSSMGSMSLRPPQTNHGLAHGQQSQSLIGSSASGAALFQGSQVAWQNYSSGNPPPVVHTQSNPAHNSSAMSLPPSAIHSAHTIHGPVVQSMPELHGSSSTVNQPGSGGGSNMVYPLWSNINADGFHAYQHHIPVETSNFSGTKYALIIGINYYNKDYSQTSNINSAHAFRNILVSRFGYLEKNVTLLSDDQQDLRSHPTYSLITSNMKRMMREVRPNDSVFFYYCGFGKLPMQVQDKRSETLSAIRRLRSDYILPGDFETAGAIDAAYLHKYLVRQLPQSARLTALLNCIVNETGLGVPYKYTQPNGMAVLTNAIAGSNLFEANVGVNPGSNASFGDLSQRFETNLMQQYPQGSPTVDPETEMSRLQQSSGDIVVFSWDRDYANPNHRNYLSHTPSNQLGNYWGAAMESALRDKPKPTYGDMLGYLHDSTKSLVMLPFIASGRKISMSEPFDI